MTWTDVPGGMPTSLLPHGTLQVTAHMPDPRISIITINRNGGATVARTVASVRQQQQMYQWVVIDGASNDGSEALLRAAVQPGDVCISEPDRGIADAFNKGLRLAAGDAVLFMNAGDEFARPDALSQLVAAWDRSRYRWIAGTADVVDEQGRALYRRAVAQPRDPRDLIRTDCRIFHQAALCERHLLLEAGGFDESYRIGMDYDLWCRLLRAGHTPQMVQIAVCRYRVGGVSGNVLRRLTEHRRARAASGMANPWWYELRLSAIARAKHLLRGCVGGWAYRFKEWLRW